MTASKTETWQKPLPLPVEIASSEPVKVDCPTCWRTGLGAHPCVLKTKTGTITVCSACYRLIMTLGRMVHYGILRPVRDPEDADPP